MQDRKKKTAAILIPRAGLLPAESVNLFEHYILPWSPSWHCGQTHNTTPMTLIITAAKPVHMYVTAPAQLVDVWERDQSVVVPVLDLPGLAKVLFSVEEYRVIHNLSANMQLHMCCWKKNFYCFRFICGTLWYPSGQNECSVVSRPAPGLDLLHTNVVCSWVPCFFPLFGLYWLGLWAWIPRVAALG